MPSPRPEPDALNAEELALEQLPDPPEYFSDSEADRYERWLDQIGGSR